MITIIVIITMKLAMQIMIIIHMMNYWRGIFHMKMIHRRMKEATILTMKKIKSLIMIISRTFDDRI